MRSAASPAKYAQPRAGLGDLPLRLRSEPCKIAYLGASVTVQRNGYRPMLHASLEAICTHRHASVTAGISGSGSISGVFVMDDLVLAHRPDLCFVEFASRDGAGRTAPDWVGPAVEGIVLKLRRQGCQPCFLYLYRADERRCAYGAVRAAHERVAARYGVPSIDVAACFREALADGSATLQDIMRDVVHTTPRGAELAADAILRALLEIPAGAGGANALPERLYRESFADTRIVAAGEASLHAPQHRELGRFRLMYDYVAIGAGNRFQCRFDGELVGMLLVLGPSSAAVRISADADVREVSLWDDDCFYERLSTLIFDRRYPSGTMVTIEPVDTPFARELHGRHAATEVLPPQLKVIGFLVA